MTTGRCPECNRFLSELAATVCHVTGGAALDLITGRCSAHGLVDAVGDFWWEDFFGEYEGGFDA